MNNITRTLTAILANIALVRGEHECDQEPDANGLVVIPATWTSVPKEAFFYCDEIKKVVMPAKITAIYTNAFGSSGLEVIEFEANSKLTLIGKWAFSSTHIKSIVFEVNSHLETIGEYAFLECVELEKVVLSQGVKEILYDAFYGSSIVSIVIPPGVTSFDANDVFGETPCDDKNVFKPGNTVVNCEITSTPSPAPTELKDACVNLKKRKCRNTCVFSKRRRQCLPKSTSFEHDCAQYQGKTPCLENKVCKFPDGQCVHRCDGKNAQRCRKHKFCNLENAVNPCFGCHLVTACGPRR